jgi:hypothetical protein
MGSRLRKFLVAVLAVSLLNGTAHAATKKPTPKPTVKVTTKATAKATPKVTTKATAKSTAKPTATTKSTAKPTAKATASATATKKKVVVYKPRPRKKVKVSPSPKPVWPPKGYVKNDDIYAKVPTSKELIGLSSANKKLASALKDCENLTCGAIFATSIAGCNWWEFTGDVTGPASETDKTIIKYGAVKSLFGSSKAKEIQTFIMVSQEPIKTGFLISNIQMLCHRDAAPPDLTIPSHSYIKAN